MMDNQCRKNIQRGNSMYLITGQQEAQCELCKLSKIVDIIPMKETISAMLKLFVLFIQCLSM